MAMRFIPSLYDFLMAPLERSGLGGWRQHLVEPAHGRILEIGAGTGLNFQYYRRRTWVVATDVDFAMISRSATRARAAAADIALVVADAEALPFRADTFTEAIVGLAMCTIPDPGRSLAELRRTIVGGGRLRLLEHVRVKSPLIGQLQDWLTPLWTRVAGGCHLNRRTLDTVSRSGFVVESVRSHLGGYLQEIVVIV